MKSLILTCIILLASLQITFAQSVYKGIALRKINDYNLGDTGAVSIGRMANEGFAVLRPSSWSTRHIHILVKRYR